MRHSIVYIRKDGLNTPDIAICEFDCEESDGRKALDEAVTHWIDETEQGRLAYEDSCEDFNIGDLANWQEEDLLVEWGVENLSIEGLEFHSTETYDHLMYQGDKPWENEE